MDNDSKQVHYSSLPRYSSSSPALEILPGRQLLMVRERPVRGAGIDSHLSSIPMKSENTKWLAILSHGFCDVGGQTESRGTIRGPQRDLSCFVTSLFRDHKKRDRTSERVPSSSLPLDDAEHCCASLSLDFSCARCLFQSLRLAERQCALSWQLRTGTGPRSYRKQNRSGPSEECSGAAVPPVYRRF
jgi:hypothetical protein